MSSASTLRVGSKRSNSPEETFAFGQTLGHTLVPGDIVAFFGYLGAGKTHLIKGIAASFANIDPEDVQSPTFTYLNTYDNVHHFDLYRLQNSDDFLNKGFDDYFGNGLCLIEWAERIEDILPENAIRIRLTAPSRETRLIEVL